MCPLPYDSTLSDGNIVKETTMFMRIKSTYRGGICGGCLAGVLRFLNVAQSYSHETEGEIGSSIYSSKQGQMTIIRGLIGKGAGIAPLPMKSKSAFMRIIKLLCVPKEGTPNRREAITATLKFQKTMSTAVNEIAHKYRRSSISKSNVDTVIRLHQERCPVCFDRFESERNSQKCPYRVCSLSDKHSVCRACVESYQLRDCPLCRSTVMTEVEPCLDHIQRLRELALDLRSSCMYLGKSSNKAIADDPPPVIDTSTLTPFACGAFCDVYKIEDYRGATIALKVPRFSLGGDRGRELEKSILHEIAVAMPLSHINYFVCVLGAVETDRGVGIAMEFVKGPTLAVALQNESTDAVSKMSKETRMQICLHICRGVSELHAAGIIHRDLKPENIILSINGSNGSVVAQLTDFGISTLIQTATGTHGLDHGTVGYSAPEICDAGPQTPIQKSGDIYSLSFVLYEVLAGRRVFAGLTSAQILTQYVLRGVRPPWPSGNESSSVAPTPAIMDVINSGWSQAEKDRPTAVDFVFACSKPSLVAATDFQDLLDTMGNIPQISELAQEPRKTKQPKTLFRFLRPLYKHSNPHNSNLLECDLSDEEKILEAVEEDMMVATYVAHIGQRMLAGDVEFMSEWLRRYNEYTARSLFFETCF